MQLGKWKKEYLLCFCLIQRKIRFLMCIVSTFKCCDFWNYFIFIKILFQGDSNQNCAKPTIFCSLALVYVDFSSAISHNLKLCIVILTQQFKGQLCSLCLGFATSNKLVWANLSQTLEKSVGCYGFLKNN